VLPSSASNPVPQAAEAARVELKEMKAKEAEVVMTLHAALEAADKMRRKRRRLERKACVECSVLAEVSPQDAPEYFEEQECVGCGATFCEACVSNFDVCCGSVHCSDCTCRICGGA
jgi:hypothetical protein